MHVNWIVGTKSKIGVDSNAYIIDKLTPNGEVHTLNYILAVVNVLCFSHSTRSWAMMYLL